MPCFRIFCVRIIINVTFSELFYNTFFHFWNRLTHLLSYFLTMLFSFVCFWPDMINYFFRGGPGGLIKDYSNYNHSYRFIYRRDFFSSHHHKTDKNPAAKSYQSHQYWCLCVVTINRLPVPLPVPSIRISKLRLSAQYLSPDPQQCRKLSDFIECNNTI